jgi:hypothetical protein
VENKNSQANVSKNWRSHEDKRLRISIHRQMFRRIAVRDPSQKDKRWRISIRKRMSRRIGPRRFQPRRQTMENKHSQTNVSKNWRQEVQAGKEDRVWVLKVEASWKSIGPKIFKKNVPPNSIATLIIPGSSKVTL